MGGYLIGTAWMYGALVALIIQEVIMSVFPVASATIIGTWREPGDRLSTELRRYARIEGLDPADLRPARPTRDRSARGRSTAAAVRDWVAGLRRPERFVPGSQH